MSEHIDNSSMDHLSLLATFCAQQKAEQHKFEMHKLIEQNNFLSCRCDNLHTNFAPIDKYFTSNNALQRCTLPSIPLLPLENFDQVRRDNLWHSDSVYTHFQGYKICLCVYPSGTGSGTDTHMSVFICFMRGEFDNLLDWPFRGIISLQLLNQLDNEEHRSLSVVYRDGMSDDVCSQVTNADVSEMGRGSNKFALLSELEPKYLQNNKLLFRIQDVVRTSC